MMAVTKYFLPFLGFIYFYALAHLGAEVEAAPTTAAMAVPRAQWLLPPPTLPHGKLLNRATITLN